MAQRKPDAFYMTDAADLTACDREPIHLPGAIQPHGHLLACTSRGLSLIHASAAAFGTLLPADPAASWGRPLGEMLRLEPLAPLLDGVRTLPPPGPLQLGTCRDAAGRLYQAIAHRARGGETVLELEAVGPDTPEADTLERLYPLVRDAFGRLEQAEGVEALAARAAAAVRGITGFDRVLVYRFDPNWDGIVLAEEGNGRLPSYLGLRFPAADIPVQARRLYAENRQRMIVDADYRPVPVLSAPDRPAPLDMSGSVLRSVSPVHLEYMRNMGTPASMSISLLREGQLWGLLSCHHATPRLLSFAARQACDLIGQMLTVRLAARAEAEQALERTRLKPVEGLLLARMAAAENFAEGLATVPEELCRLTGAAGAAVVTPEACRLFGPTPPEAEVRRIAAWLETQGETELFETSTLPALLPGLDQHAELASGLLAISISGLHPSFVLWFRPEVVRTVIWGGDPAKAQPTETGRINPRRSFDAWKETVRGRAESWTPVQIEAARDLRTDIVRIVLRKAEEMAELTGRLERINRELTAFSYSISHDLRAPFRHIVGYAELLRELEGERLSEKGQRFLATIIESAETAGRLVDALLNFSQMGRVPLTRMPVDTAMLVEEARRMLEPDTAGRSIAWQVGPLPMVQGDPTMLRQVFTNLLSNAIKYTKRREQAVIEVGCESGEAEHVFFVRDNGTGFDMAYAHKLFGVFQRLHRMEDFEGVGIGLANVRRIIERHGGRVWAEGTVGVGATFRFSLPHGETG